MTSSEKQERLENLAERLSAVTKRKAPGWQKCSRGLRQQIKSVQQSMRVK